MADKNENKLADQLDPNPSALTVTGAAFNAFQKLYETSTDASDKKQPTAITTEDFEFLTDLPDVYAAMDHFVAWPALHDALEARDHARIFKDSEESNRAYNAAAVLSSLNFSKDGTTFTIPGVSQASIQKIAHASRFNWMKQYLNEEITKAKTKEAKGKLTSQLRAFEAFVNAASSGSKTEMDAFYANKEHLKELKELFGPYKDDAYFQTTKLVLEIVQSYRENALKETQYKHQIISNLLNDPNSDLAKKLKKRKKGFDTLSEEEKVKELYKLFEANKTKRKWITGIALFLGILAAIAFATSFMVGTITSSFLPTALVWTMVGVFGIPSILQEVIVSARAIPDFATIVFSGIYPTTLDELIAKYDAKADLTRKRHSVTGELLVFEYEAPKTEAEKAKAEKEKRQRQVTFAWKLALFTFNALASFALVTFGFAAIFGLVVASGLGLTFVPSALLVLPVLLGLAMFVVSMSFNLNRALGILKERSGEPKLRHEKNGDAPGRTKDLKANTGVVMRWHGKALTTFMALASVAVVALMFVGGPAASFGLLAIVGVFPLITVMSKMHSYRLDASALARKDLGFTPDQKLDKEQRKALKKEMKKLKNDPRAQELKNKRKSQAIALIAGLSSAVIVAMGFFSLAFNGVVVGPYIAMVLVGAVAYTQYMAYRGSITGGFYGITDNNTPKIGVPNQKRGFFGNALHKFFNSKAGSRIAEVVNFIKGFNKTINAFITLGLFFGLFGGAALLATPGGQAIVAALIIFVAITAIADGLGVFHLYRSDFKGKNTYLDKIGGALNKVFGHKKAPQAAVKGKNTPEAVQKGVNPVQASTDADKAIVAEAAYLLKGTPSSLATSVEPNKPVSNEPESKYTDTYRFTR